MRLAPFMVVLFVMYLSINVLDKTLDPTLQNPDSTGVSYFALILQPSLWDTNSFIVLLIGFIGAVSLITATIGILTRSDIVTLSGGAASLMAMGAIPIIQLYWFMSRNVGSMTGCIPGDPCASAMIVGSLTAGVVGLMWVMTVLEFWLWRPVTQ